MALMDRSPRAHGGQNAVAGQGSTLPRLNAVFRGTTRTIRAWQGHGDAEEFTVDEALALCRRGDMALMDLSDAGAGMADLMVDAPQGTLNCITLPRVWLTSFLAALRRALRTAETLQALAPKPSGGCIDNESDPGSWEEHLNLTAAMRGAL